MPGKPEKAKAAFHWKTASLLLLHMADELPIKIAFLIALSNVVLHQQPALQMC